MNDKELQRHLADKEVTALWTTHGDTDVGRHRVEVEHLPKVVFMWANKPGGNKKLLAALQRIDVIRPAAQSSNKRVRHLPEGDALVFYIPPPKPEELEED